jgi:hypothetical protein
VLFSGGSLARLSQRYFLQWRINMTMETAALLGMGAVLIFGLVALVFAFLAGDDKKSDSAKQRHA